MMILNVLANLDVLSYRVPTMTAVKSRNANINNGLPEWARQISSRRAYLGKSQDRVAADSHDKVYQTQISRVEKGKLHPTKDLPFDAFFGLLKGLEWTVVDFTRETGIEVEAQTREQAEAIEAARYLEVHPKWLRFPVYGCASAGEDDPDPLQDEVAYIPIEKLRAKGADPRYVHVYLANGDCMVSQEAKLIEKNIAHGDYIAVDVRRKPQPGETVVAWWNHGSKLVVKRYKIENEQIVLYPVNPGHVNLVAESEDDLTIIGVVVWREG